MSLIGQKRMHFESFARIEVTLSRNDAIIKKSGVTREKLTYVHDNSNDEYRITVCDPISNKMLGYLFFFKKRGMLELCNFGSELPRQALNMGWTSKKQDDDLAGKHGKGLKLAASVMVREGHQTRLTASGFYWNFRCGANDECLCCYLTEVERKFLKSWSLRSNDLLASSPSTDVSVELGNVHGYPGKPIMETEFMDWLKVYLHFNRPDVYTETKCGTIIMERGFADKIYFKGLLGDATSAQGCFRCGYDFFKLEAGRHEKARESVQNRVLLEQTLADMWASAIQSRPVWVLDFYIDMLSSSYEWRDVSGIGKNMSRPTAVAIWDRLQEKITRRKLFYYRPRDEDEDVSFIIKFLDRQPERLQARIWLPLRKYGLIQTPSEYRENKLSKAQDAVVEKVKFPAAFKDFEDCRESEITTEKLVAQINTLKDQNRGLTQEQETMQAEYKELKQENEQLQQGKEESQTIKEELKQKEQQWQREKEELQANNKELQEEKQLLKTLNEQLQCVKHEGTNDHHRSPTLDDNTSAMEAMKQLVTEVKAAERAAKDETARVSDLLSAARNALKTAIEDKKKAENGEETMTKTVQRLLNKREPGSDDGAEDRRRGNSRGGLDEKEQRGEERAAKKVKVEEIIVLD
ncbi:glycoside hydrolase family 76 protein [Rutstroemia sp. NJR-2017a WRK4]|nr:glycoside hydrolase family 76 protein [Rutstroemia sp. NJR-2017a WRK4]